jgi:hypothetical protein
MRARRMFPAPHLYPSDSTRQGPRRAGMRGLGHKSRHKILCGGGCPARVVQQRRALVAGDAAIAVRPVGGRLRVSLYDAYWDWKR